MQFKDQKEEDCWKFALDSIGDRIWNNTDMFFAITFGAVMGFCLGMLLWMICHYS